MALLFLSDKDMEYIGRSLKPMLIVHKLIFIMQPNKQYCWQMSVVAV